MKARAYRLGPEADHKALRERLATEHPHALVQTLDPGSVPGDFAVRMVAAQTMKAAKSGNLLAKRPEIDFLLRMAGTTQISLALKTAGAKSGEPFVLVIVGTEAVGLKVEGGRPLPSKSPTREDYMFVEKAALLNAERA